MGKHTILLTQFGPNQRQYHTFDGVNEALSGILKLFELHLSRGNPNRAQLSYDVQDVYRYIDSLKDFGMLVYEEKLNAYVPHDSQWAKSKLLAHLQSSSCLWISHFMSIHRIQELLRDRRHAWVRDDWLQECIRFVGPGSDEEIVDKVFAQLACTDLKVAGEPCLPPLSRDPRDTSVQNLLGTYLLQIEDSINVGENYERRDADNKNRCMKFKLTDGVGVLHAFEYRRVPSLSVDIPPGTKSNEMQILLKDGRARMGLVMLDADSISLIGGTVQEMIDEKKNKSQPSGDGDSGASHPQTNGHNVQPNQRRVEEPIVIDDMDDIDIEDIYPPSPKKDKTPLHDRTIPRDKTPQSHKPTASTPADRITKGGEQIAPSPISPVYNDEDYQMMDWDDDWANQSIAADKHNDSSYIDLPKEDPSSKRPFVYLFEMEDFIGDGTQAYDPNVTVKYVKIKGAITNTILPFGYKGQFSLKVKIDDGTRCMVVMLSNLVIEKILGITNSTFNDNFQRPDGKATNMEKLKKMEKSLATLQGIMDVQFSTTQEMPIVTSIEPTNGGDLEQMCKMLDRSLED
ncbi:hypothetical protein PROFUN_11775 [Planoprotostelium fungivorum]|uniref:RecQ-mediated genome instability protein 1 n=1 Tax=Planoprotostelium fungivorum TaxID=1890364 RepID=A0A2P6N8K8_9EUKA|nr:hypothetical protein PROFUN_11775 [Planoprotostelium fungivorum]